MSEIKTPTEGAATSHWERQTLQKILLEHLYEQRRARRWGIFFKITFIIFVILFLLYAAGILTKDVTQPVIATDHTALIDITGEISEDNTAASSDQVRASLKSAFENKHAKAVILRINSPGGNPVQARHIYDHINYFKKKYQNTKVYAVIEDTGTSAAYLIACAADAIYCDKTSIVGSIGVKIDSFGFVDAMQKLGIERRLYTAGKFKGALDQFSPRNPEEDAFVESQLAMVHRAFIDNVRQGRGDRLKETSDMFSGQFWTGEDALNLGLVDGFADAYQVAREIVKVDELVDYSPASTLLDRLANKLGAAVTETFMKIRWK